MKGTDYEHIIYIEETGTVSDKDAKESDQLKREVCRDCAEWLKDYLSPEQLKRFEHDFNTVAARYVFKKSK